MLNKERISAKTTFRPKKCQKRGERFGSRVPGVPKLRDIRLHGLAVMNELELADAKPKNYHCKTDEEKIKYLDLVAMKIVTKLVLPNKKAPMCFCDQCD